MANFTLQDLYGYQITSLNPLMKDNLCDANLIAKTIDTYMDSDCKSLLPYMIMNQISMDNPSLCSCMIQIADIELAAKFACYIGYGLVVTIYDQYLQCTN